MTTDEHEPHKAHIEVLTAEVRTLMVGKRQITLSVYRQLDRVKPEEIAPMGRVRDKEEQGVEVIGRHSDGPLVRSYCPPVPEIALIHPRPDGGAWAFVHPNHQGLLNIRQCAADGLSVAASTVQGTRTLPSSMGLSYIRDELRVPQEQLDQLQQQGWCYATHDAQQYVERLADNELAHLRRMLPIQDAWTALPLIVLAGLR